MKEGIALYEAKELHEIIYAMLHTQIAFGAYPYKASLPRMEDAAKWFSVSVDTIHATYLKLKKEGYLFTENLELLKKTVLAIHEAGYLCSMDDFGSGYSSLSLLKEVPVDILKLDRTFFDDAANTRSDRVVEHVIALAKDLHMQTIAEGIETMEQVEQLRGMQCDLIQGYVFYKPMDIASFQQLMEQEEIDRA